MNISKQDISKVFQNKLNAEKAIINNLEFSDTREYCDTIGVTESFVEDVDEFFKIFNDASLELAFSAPWQIVNHTELALEPPYWMNFIEYLTFGAWILCSIEKSIWLHFFHANDSQVRKIYLCHIFNEWMHVENKRYRIQVICDFWRETPSEIKRAIFQQLLKKIQSDYDSEKNIDQIRNTLSSNNDNACEVSQAFQGWTVNTKWSSDEEEKSSNLNEYIENGNSNNCFIFLDYLDYATQNDFLLLISKGNNLSEVNEFIHFLSHSKIERCDMPIDSLCRMLLKIIDETHQEITLKELLESEEKLTTTSSSENSKNLTPPKTISKDGRKHRKSNSAYHRKIKDKSVLEKKLDSASSEPNYITNMAANILSKESTAVMSSDWNSKQELLEDPNKKKSK